MLSASPGHGVAGFQPPADAQAVYVRFRPSPIRIRPAVGGTPGDGSTLTPATSAAGGTAKPQARKPSGYRIDGIPRIDGLPDSAGGWYGQLNLLKNGGGRGGSQSTDKGGKGDDAATPADGAGQAVPDPLAGAIGGTDFARGALLILGPVSRHGSGGPIAYGYLVTRKSGDGGDEATTEAVECPPGYTVVGTVKKAGALGAVVFQPRGQGAGGDAIPPASTDAGPSDPPTASVPPSGVAPAGVPAKVDRPGASGGDGTSGPQPSVAVAAVSAASAADGSRGAADARAVDV
ncbi:MAG TPA: hypothetical protein VF796_09805, partial [Humisphaera sp.]